MIETLKEYVNENQGENLAMTLDHLKDLLGDHKSLYYGILRATVNKFLRGAQNSTSRCILLYGASSSGKSTIAKYLGSIFLSFGLRQHKGIFDEQITALDSNVQLLILDEAHVYKLFSRDNLADTKQLLEGGGRSIAIKFAHSYTGFKGCFTVVTCNNLPYPFIPPTNNTAGFSIDEYDQDKIAMNSRCKIFKMTKTFDREASTFPFGELEWA